ncbi:hypothetical protein FGB62_48g110 [Gracilaria domingensis]|nr:hypothetical protein FGB62_48g110 [Gracilaria domingensis]
MRACARVCSSPPTAARLRAELPPRPSVAPPLARRQRPHALRAASPAADHQKGLRSARVVQCFASGSPSPGAAARLLVQHLGACADAVAFRQETMECFAGSHSSFAVQLAAHPFAYAVV